MTSTAPRQRNEYKQDRYKAAQGKFDGNLNRRAEEGWKVLSIDALDGDFLVTYERPLPSRVQTGWATTVSNGVDEFFDELSRQIDQGFTLAHFSTAVMHNAANLGLSHAVIITAIWKRTRRT